jgi:hypothetical protein
MCIRENTREIASKPVGTIYVYPKNTHKLSMTHAFFSAHGLVSINKWEPHNLTILVPWSHYDTQFDSVLVHVVHKI